MQVQVGYKYRIRPTEKQMDYLSRCFGCTRLVYNKYVVFAKEDSKRVRETGDKFRKLPEITEFKKEFPFLSEIDSLALSNTKQQFQAALNNWWKSLQGKRKGRKLKAPNFKKKGKCKDTYTTNNQNGTIKLCGTHLKVPKLKEPIEVVLHRPLPNGCEIKFATFSREKDGSYFVSLSIVFELETTERVFKPLDELRVVGLDMSMEHFVVSSNELENDPEFNGFPKYIRQYRKAEKRLKRLNRQHSRKLTFDTGEYVFSKKWQKDVEKKEPSKNKEKARLRLAKLHRKVANKRREHALQTAVYYAKNYDVIIIEDIDMQAMARTLHLGKSACDLGFGQFKAFLEWQTKKRGCLLAKADKWFASSKTCNDCGFINKALKLSDREWVCPECGCIHDRDFNAALNLRDWYYQQYNTAGTAEINACGDCTSMLELRPNASVVVEAGKSISDGGSPSL